MAGRRQNNKAGGVSVVIRILTCNSHFSLVLSGPTAIYTAIILILDVRRIAGIPFSPVGFFLLIFLSWLFPRSPLPPLLRPPTDPAFSAPISFLFNAERLAILHYRYRTRWLSGIFTCTRSCARALGIRPFIVGYSVLHTNLQSLAFAYW